MDEFQGKELTLVHLDIYGAPPYIILAGLFKDNSLVFRTSAGLLAREVDERARRGNDGPFVADGIFVKLGYRRIALELDPVHVKSCLGEVLEVMADDYSRSCQ